MVERIKSEVPNLRINAWYLDDGTLCGSPSELTMALKIIEEEGPPRSLFLNRAKSLLYIPADDEGPVNPLPSEIPITGEGFVLLGSPIGPPSFNEAVVLNRVEKVKEILSKLQDLEDAQIEASLLRSCLALSKISFSLRTAPPITSRIPVPASMISCVRLCLDLAGSPVSDWAWLKASLPSYRGGLNLRRACLHAPAAYIGSLDQLRGLVSRIVGHTPPSFHQATSVELLTEAAGPDWTSLDELDVPHRQRPLSHSIDDCCFQLLLDSAPDMRSTALAHSSSLPHAGDWLNAIPSSALGLHILDSDFRLCLVYWLGLRMVARITPPVQSVRGGLMVTVTTKSVVGGMGTGSTGMTPSVMHFSLQHSWLL